MKCILPIVFALLALPHPSSAASSDGNKLLEDCGAIERLMDGGKSTSNSTGMGFCLGLMQGITNSNMIYQVRAPGKELLCLPKNGIENGQAARVVVKYLRDHPEQLHENDFVLAMRALRDAFPCSE